MNPEMKRFVSTFQRSLVVPVQDAFRNLRIDYPWTEEIGSQALAECLSTLRISPFGEDSFTLKYTFMGDRVVVHWIPNGISCALEHRLWELYTYLNVPDYTKNFPSPERIAQLKQGIYQLLKYLSPYKYE